MQTKKNNKDLFWLIALNLIDGIGVKNAKNLISYTGSIEAIFTEKHHALIKIPGIGNITASKIKNSSVFKRAEQELKFIEKYKIKHKSYFEKNYPHRLKQCEDAPLLFFYKGDVDFEHKKIITIVGTRKSTEYGKQNIKNLITDLATRGHNPIIVSGLAYGTDIYAHKEAIKNNLQTVAVLGHGLDRVYPQAHTSIAKQIITQGALLSEFLSETNPDRQNFVKRNRIVAGLSDCTIVIESGKKGGSLITADIANSYSRDVFAYPGNITNDQSIGCNKLIKNHKAALIENILDLEYIMGWDNENKNIQTKLVIPPSLNKQEQLVFSTITKEKSINIDVLCEKTKINSSDIAIILLNLELHNIIKVFPGNMYKPTI